MIAKPGDVAAEVAHLRGRAEDFRYFARRSRALGRRAEMFDSLRAAALCTVAALRLINSFPGNKQ
jgi:hypothetical protein